MFRRLLRQLNICIQDDGYRIEYKCKKCSKWVLITLTQEEWNDLGNGIPFNNVFCEKRRESLIHFKKGMCEKCPLV